MNFELWTCLKKKNLESSKPLAFIAKFLELRVWIKKKKKTNQFVEQYKRVITLLRMYVQQETHESGIKNQAVRITA